MLSYFPSYYAKTSISLYVALLLALVFYYYEYSLPLVWMSFGLVTVVGFFVALNILSIKWADIPPSVFKSNIFFTSLVLRLLWVFGSYWFYKEFTGQPFEFRAADSIWYDYKARIIIDNQLDYLAMANPTNSGYIFYLSVIYKLFGESILLPRIIKAFLGSFTVLIIYRFTQRNFGEKVGRIAAVISMLLPNFIYYCGLNLREIEMVFLLMAVMDRADIMLRYGITKIRILMTTILLLVLLFYTRTVLASAVVISIFATLLMSSEGMVRFKNRLVYIVIFLLFGLTILSTRISNDIESYWDKSSNNQEGYLTKIASRAHGNSLATYGSGILFIPIMVPAPFPTMVFIETQENVMLLNGTYFVRNALAYFVFVALLLMYRRKVVKKYILILSFLLAYYTVLTTSGFALAERFHMPLLPFLIMLISYGISNINSLRRKRFIPYVILLFIVIIGWNWFKLAGRGLV